MYREPRAHQRDEVGEGHLDVDLGDVPALLHGPDVLVVALHQVPEELVLQVVVMSVNALLPSGDLFLKSSTETFIFQLYFS